MKAALLAVALVAGSARAAFADGWWKACDTEHGDGACQQTGDGSYTCNCDAGDRSSSQHRALHVGTGLAMLGLVGWRLGRKRRHK